MKFRRPRTLNELILVGFGLVALPLIFAVLWTMFSLDRLATQSERLVATGVEAADNNRELLEDIGLLDRHARQFVILNDPGLLQVLRGDLESITALLVEMEPLAKQASGATLARSIGNSARYIVNTLATSGNDADKKQQALEQIAPLRQQANRLTRNLNAYVDLELRALQESVSQAQRISAWQVAALIPGTLILVLFFTLLVARPIRQIDAAIDQLGRSGFARPISVTGPTDLRRLGRQLEWLRVRLLELAHEKNRFLRHMSHELKTPLANIREGTELLMDGTLGDLDKPQREVADILRMNGLKLLQLIENLLSFSAWQAKQEVLTQSDFPIRTLVIAVAKEQRLALKAAHIQLRLDVDDVIVNADRDKIRTVLDNLLSNAVKFTPRGGFVTIRVKREATSLVIDFADTGPGIPDEEKPRIFEAFFQGRREQGGHVAGTGIGLSVVLECVQAHNGRVEIVDSNEFPGAHFRIEIPQKRETQTQKLAANA